MPIVHIDMMRGRTEEQLAAVIRGVTDAIVTALDAPPESIRVVINEMDPHQYGVGGDPWPVVVERRRAAAGPAGRTAATTSHAPDRDQS